MKIYISLDADDFANGWASMPIGENSIEMELPEGHSFFSNILAHQLIGTEFVFDEKRSKANAENEAKNMKGDDSKAEIALLKTRQSEFESKLNKMAGVTPSIKK